MVDDDRRRTPDHGHPISSPCEPNGSGELKMVDDDDGRRQTPEHGHPISSPCEPNGSGELTTLFQSWSPGHKTNFMLNSAETKIYPAYKC